LGALDSSLRKRSRGLKITGIRSEIDCTRIYCKVYRRWDADRHNGQLYGRTHARYRAQWRHPETHLPGSGVN